MLKKLKVLDLSSNNIVYFTTEMLLCSVGQGQQTETIIAHDRTLLEVTKTVIWTFHFMDWFLGRQDFYVDTRT
jgi:hypothetical protein